MRFNRMICNGMFLGPPLADGPFFVSFIQQVYMSPCLDAPAVCCTLLLHPNEKAALRQLCHLFYVSSYMSGSTECFIRRIT